MKHNGGRRLARLALALALAALLAWPAVGNASGAAAGRCGCARSDGKATGTVVCTAGKKPSQAMVAYCRALRQAGL